MIKIIVLSFLFLLSPVAFSQDLVKENREVELYHTATQLQGNLNVLMISLQPGFEDLAALAYFRLERGANVTSVYVTNGALLESSEGDEYPHLLAATRRYEAADACNMLGVETHFMNLPDLGATPDTAKVWTMWNKDTLKIQLLQLLVRHKPDILVLSLDKMYGPSSIRWRAFQDQLLSILQRLRTRRPSPFGGLQDAEGWRVNRVLMENETPSGMRLPARQMSGWPTEKVHPVLQKSYQQLGAEAQRAYASMTSYSWTASGQSPTYDFIFLASSTKLKSLEEGLPRPVGRELGWLGRETRNIAGVVRKDYKSLLAEPRKASLTVRRLVTAIDSASYHLKFSYEELSHSDRRVLVHWKQTLEDLRILLLGVRISYSISETVVTNSQLTFLTIDTVYGLPKDGTSEIFFPDVGKKWIVNEAYEQRIPLTLRQPYRLISPRGMKYDLPPQEFGIEKNVVGTPFYFYVIHNNPLRWKSFVLPVKVHFFFAPKFTAEILNPIVRLMSDEYFVVRLTNHSRDGVADTLYVADSIALSTKHAFRLSTKESSLMDTIRLVQTKSVGDGSYLLPVEIGGERVSQFVARAITAKFDSSKMVGLITAYEKSATAESLCRLRARWKPIRAQEISDGGLANFQTIIVDSRALSDKTGINKAKASLLSFVENGGHLIVMPQNPEAWSEHQLLPGVTLHKSQSYDESVTVDADSSHRLLASPNPVSSDDWNDWLWFRAYASTEINPGADVEIPVRAQNDGNPLVIMKKVGRGTMTYVNLALQPQLMNVHPGALRLLANLISY